MRGLPRASIPLTNTECPLPLRSFGADCLPLFPQEMSVGYANGIRVMSMTHTGEPGFMLYIPIEVSSQTAVPGVRAVPHLLSTSDWA